MRRKTTWFVLCALATLFVLAVSGAATAQEVTIKGLIVSRDGENMLVRGEQGGNSTVTLTDNTKIEVVKGLIGVRKEEMEMAALVPGLRVEIKGEISRGQTIAKSVKFKADDLKTANQIQAAMIMTQQQVQANQQKIQANQQQIAANKQVIEETKSEAATLSKRFAELDDYDVKGEASILFAVNSAALSEKAKEDLNTLSANAKTLPSKYLIHVSGYTDATGAADFNTELSDRRAGAVITYLRQSCGVPIARVLSPAAMGMTKPVASNESAQGKAENRRVEVKVIVNRGLSQ